MDGFNDVVLASGNVQSGIDPSVPSAGAAAAEVLLDAQAVLIDRLELVVRARRDGQRASRFRVADGADASRRCLALARLRRDAAARSAAAANRALVEYVGAQDGVLRLEPWRRGATADDPDHLDAAVSLWARAAAEVRDLLCAEGVPSAQVIQPNQYVSHKPFSDEERRVAINPASPYADAARAGYPRLLARLPALAARGVDITSAVDLFDTESRPVYADDCCHLNQLGNDLLARFVAERAAHAATCQGGMPLHEEAGRPAAAADR
ncbi:MAG: hypothetical protein R2712_10195 [Vicinamibacterales bacterium]